MAAKWRRCIRRLRFKHPSSPNVFSRNRSLICVIIAFPLCLLVLVVPGSEIANLKYPEPEGATSAEHFISLLSSFAQRREGDGSDGVHREARSVGHDSGKQKLIYLFNTFFESRSWRVQGNAFHDCPDSQCRLTTEAGKLDEADAVVFNIRGLPPPDKLPSHPPWQVWILHNSEPPYNIYFDLKRYGNVFNWTSWYRRDADIFSPYGGYVYRTNVADNGINFEAGNDNENGQVAHAPDEASETDMDAYGRHDKVIFFAAYNCQDRGRRYKKVAQLRQFLPIDQYGDCGPVHCPKGSAECEQEFARYQFALAFEDGYCRDYVTEKLWNAYRRLQIPIVSGGADYEKLAIPGSYIDYDNFSSPEELARFVHRVSTNPSLYNSFFKWRERFQVIQTPVADWCGICEALQDEGRPPQVYKDLEGWVAQDSCPLYSYYQGFWTWINLGIFKLFGV